MSTDERRMRYVQELYFKSPAEMAALFRRLPGGARQHAGDRRAVRLKIEFGKPKYPNYTPPPGLTQNEYLREICRRRAGADATANARLEDPVIAERLRARTQRPRDAGVRELLPHRLGFHRTGRRSTASRWGPGAARRPARWSPTLMGITDIDPIRFKLLFERFLNPERVSPPDIDVDFCQNRRGEVIEYVRQKYGERAVSQIITFGTLGAKSVVRDVARVQGWSYGDADRIAKMIPSGPAISTSRSNGEDKKNKETGRDRARRRRDRQEPGAEESGRDGARHRAAVGVRDASSKGSRAAWACMPPGWSSATAIFRNTSRSPAATMAASSSQYAMGPLTDLGMLKMDFLGLKTLTVIHDARGADSPARRRISTSTPSRSTIRRPSTCSIAARRSRCSNWNPAAWSASASNSTSTTSRISTRSWRSIGRGRWT